MAALSTPVNIAPSRVFAIDLPAVLYAPTANGSPQHTHETT
jgi:hypothetical protein